MAQSLNSSAGQSNPFSSLFFYSMLMIVLPIGGFFLSKGYIFENIFGYSDGSIGAVIVAVILVHVVIAAYVYAAWNEGSKKID